MAKFYRTEPFKGPLMRISYAWQMFTAREGKYGCTLIMPKNGDWSTLQAAVIDVVKNQWSDKGAAKWKAGLIKSPFLDGDSKQAHHKETGELHGGMGPDVQFIRVTSGEKFPPKVFDAPLKRCSVLLPNSPYLLFEAEDCPSGSWGYPVLNAYAWNSADSGDGVSFGIDMLHVTKIATGDEILGGSGGGGANPGAFFEAVKGADAGEKPESAGDFFG
jgi:hypothetical protein